MPEEKETQPNEAVSYRTVDGGPGRSLVGPGAAEQALGVNPPRQSSPAGFAAREAALALLQAVLDRDQPLDEALASESALVGMAARDRGFARLLVATVLRRLGQIDALIDDLLAKPLPTRARAIRHVLRLGAAQLLFLKTPPHAAVDLAVRQAARVPSFRGLVNAVLRRLAEAGPEALESLPVWRNCPDWLWSSWRDRFGEATAQAIVQAIMAEPPLDLTPARDPEGWAKRLGGRLLANGSIRLVNAGAIEAIPGYDEGAWWVQDAAASLPARLLGDVRGRRVLDLCAAPGGKTLQLAAAGAEVVALDRSPGRMRRLRENLDRTGLKAETVVADLREWRPADRAELVLLDPPCSATGTIRRHPDIWRLKSAADVARMAELQQALLARAVDLLADGGRLIYCVCSLEAAEGASVVEAVLEATPGLARLPISEAELGGLAASPTGEGDLVTHPAIWPETGGLDGFQIFRLTRGAGA